MVEASKINLGDWDDDQKIGSPSLSVNLSLVKSMTPKDEIHH
jgi:hypothetical protein